MLQRGPTGDRDGGVCLCAAARTLYLFVAVPAEGRTENSFFRRPSRNITLARPHDLGLLQRSPPSLLCFHRALLSRVDGRSTGSVCHHLLPRRPCHSPVRDLHRCLVRLHQGWYILHPRQSRRPRRREFVLAQCLRLLRDRGYHLRAPEAISRAGMDRDRATVSRATAGAYRENSWNRHSRPRSWTLTSFPLTQSEKTAALLP